MDPDGVRLHVIVDSEEGGSLARTNYALYSLPITSYAEEYVDVYSSPGLRNDDDNGGSLTVSSTGAVFISYVEGAHPSAGAGLAWQDMNGTFQNGTVPVMITGA